MKKTLIFVVILGFLSISSHVEAAKPTYDDLLKTIAKLESKIQELEGKVYPETKKIVSKIAKLDKEYTELSEMKVCKTNKSKKGKITCLTEVSKTRKLKELEDNKKELQTEYAIIKGDLDSLPK